MVAIEPLLASIPEVGFPGKSDIFFISKSSWDTILGAIFNHLFTNLINLNCLWYLQSYSLNYRISFFQLENKPKMNRGWIQLAASHPKLHRGPGSSLVATSDVTPVLVTWDTLESFSRDLVFGSVLRVPEAGLWGSEVNGNLVLAGSRLWVKPWIRFSGGWALHSCIGVRQLRGACVGWKGWAPSRESLLAQALLPRENPEIMPWWMMFFPCLREMQEERFAHLFASGNTKTP